MDKEVNAETLKKESKRRETKARTGLWRMPRRGLEEEEESEEEGVVVTVLA